MPEEKRIQPAAAPDQIDDPVYQSEAYTVWPDRVEQGRYVARDLSSTELVTNYPDLSAAPHHRTCVPADTMPHLQSAFPLLDALYNLSLVELQQNLRVDGALDAGARWQGVWTRDVSYSVLLSLAAIVPSAAKASLLQRTKNDRILQDTGTGGSWPVSTDRIVWALAAWEVYLVTGDRTWLDDSFRIIQNSIHEDERTVYDSDTGLFRGETSFLDWRDQTYPRWMQPADIFQSEALSTNVIHYQAYCVLEKMAKELNALEMGWGRSAERLRKSINRHFWMDDEGMYGQYRYGRSFMVLSPRVDALGCALACMFGVADRSQRHQLLQNQPRQSYGTPVVYPQAPGVPAYHNQSVWPFVESFCMMAAAKEADQASVITSVASLLRAAALFLSNKENFVLTTGDALGTAVNSDRQLWSIAGMLAVTYRLLFGMRYEPDGLYFEPFVPESLGGIRRLTHFPYRNAMLGIEVHGHGGKVLTCTIDGRDAPPMVPGDLAGEHSILIYLDNEKQATSISPSLPEQIALNTPEPVFDHESLHWPFIAGAEAYRIYRNGLPLETVRTTEYLVSAPVNCSAVLQVAAMAGNRSSYLSAPIYVGPAPAVIQPAADEILEEDAASSFPFATTQAGMRTSVVFRGVVPSAGRYELTCTYANGSGPVESDDKCAIRSLYVDNTYVGAVILPQRGQDDWNNWGESSAIHLELTAGTHDFELRFEESDRNMNGEVNTARLAHIHLTRTD